MDLDFLFYIGILIPTAITIGVFIGFLICWFKCNLKKRLIVSRQKETGGASQLGNHSGIEAETDEQIEKFSQHSADSAIDVRDLEVNTDVSERVRNQTNNHAAVIESLLSAELHCQQNTLSRGSYPSHEKLNDEINSEPRIYETQEDVELAMITSLGLSYIPSGLRSKSVIPARVKPAVQYISNSLRLPNARRIAYNNNRAYLDNHATDYGFVTWQRPHLSASRPSSIAGAMTGQQRRNQLEWKPNIATSCSDNYSIEILHV